MPGKIRINSTPAGEAPEEIRRAWVGLELDAQYSSTIDRAGGVLTRKLVDTGGCRLYWVRQDHAIAVLERASAEAASWWRALDFPDHNNLFCFREAEVEEIEPVLTQEAWMEGTAFTVQTNSNP
jgi:hypothetical protein